MSLCACGCGEECAPGRTWRRYHHTNSPIHKAQAARAASEMDSAKVLEVIHEVMAKRDLTLTETARICGMSYQHFTSLLYNKRRKKIKIATAEQILKRLGGGATPPTAHELKVQAGESHEPSPFRTIRGTPRKQRMSQRRKSRD